MRLRPTAILSTSMSRSSAVSARFLVWAVAASASLGEFLLGNGFPFAPLLSFRVAAPLVPFPFLSSGWFPFAAPLVPLVRGGLPLGVGRPPPFTLFLSAEGGGEGFVGAGAERRGLI